MKHRIRAAVIIVHGDSLLLVKEESSHPDDGLIWWVPPGGGVEGEESLMECARRETLEETGLSVELGDIVYVRDFLEPGYRHCEMFFLAASFSGSVLTGKDLESGMLDSAHEIREAQFVRRDEMQEMPVSPDVLKTTFWDDLADGFPSTRYLGVEKSSYLEHLEELAET
ncbi:MAG: NUDIX domain-containing protein [Chloroflexi bacterium]|nr:NUDIX domain-containing protein [Chloroflexota bacterium]